MSKEFEDLWRHFSLTSDEVEEVDVSSVSRPETSTVKWSMVGRVLSVRPFSLQALKSAMVGAWRPKKEFVVQEVADGIFLFRFQCKRDFEYVDGNGPWHFNKHMLILWALEMDDSSTVASLCETNF